MKVFISQPMSGLTDSQILEEREHIKEVFIEKYKDEYDNIEFISSFFTQEDPIFEEVNQLDGIEDESSKSLWLLGRALQILATADIIVFGHNWQDTRGCKIEFMAAKMYDKDMLFMENIEFDGDKNEEDRL